MVLPRMRSYLPEGEIIPRNEVEIIPRNGVMVQGWGGIIVEMAEPTMLNGDGGLGGTSCQGITEGPVSLYAAAAE